MSHRFPCRPTRRLATILVTGALVITSCSGDEQTTAPTAGSATDETSSSAPNTTTSEPTTTFTTSTVPFVPRRIPGRITEVHTQDGRTLGLDVSGCRSDPEVTWKEFDDRIEVQVIKDEAGPGDQPMCVDGVELQLDEHIGGRRLIDLASGQSLRFDIDYGDLSVTDAPVEGEELLLAQFAINYQGCRVVRPIPAPGTSSFEDEDIELVWPATDTWLTDNSVVTSRNDDGIFVRLRESDVFLLRGAPQPAGRAVDARLNRRPDGCANTTRWWVDEIVGGPGVAAFDKAGVGLDQAPWPFTEVELFEPGRDVPVNEVRFAPEVSTTCGLDRLPFQIGARWWAVETWGDDGSGDEQVLPVGEGQILDDWFVGEGVPIDVTIFREADDALRIVRFPTARLDAVYRPTSEPPPPCHNPAG